MKNKTPSKYFIGIMSGTSLDGIDICIADFDPTVKIIKSLYRPFSRFLRIKLKALTFAADNEIERMGVAETMLTQEYATTVQAVLEAANFSSKDISAIGAHGQTLRHLPPTNDHAGYTLQLINPALLSVITGITVVADFRRKDMALGGQGAPLVPAFHQQAFSSETENRVIINIGGIANISYLPTAEIKQTGFDIGPGNTLLDNWFQTHNGGSDNDHYDNHGDWAKTGKIHQQLLKQLLSDPYFKKVAPKSTGPEYFNLNWLEGYLSAQSEIKTEDIQATLTELTATSIATAIEQYCESPKVFVCGGGSHNFYLIERLEVHLKSKLTTTDSLRINPDDVESTAFAWLAKQRLEHLPGNLPSATGAKQTGILGAIYLPS